MALERQIADRAVAGDDGADARVEHVADQRERFKTDARVAGAEVAEHDEHHRARALLGDGLADGAGVGVDVVALDRLAVLFGDELLPVVTKWLKRSTWARQWLTRSSYSLENATFAPKRATLTRSLMVAVPPSVTVFISDRTS